MTDWSAWSREAVVLAEGRNDAWRDRFGLSSATRYDWDIGRAEIVFQRPIDEVVADFCLIGTIAGETFLWAWANDSLPKASIRGIDLVRAFGLQNDLPLLTTPHLRADRAQGLELLAIAARVQDADGVFVDSTDDAIVFLTLSNFRVSNPVAG